MKSARAFLEEAIASAESLKRQAEGAMAQITDEKFFQSPDEASNSVAILVKHLSGNYKSRWTDFLTTDGEKADRERDSEFVITEAETRKALMDRWAAGWATLLGCLRTLTEEDLTRTITIRGQPHSVVQAIMRTLTHTSAHVGQIVYVAKWSAGPAWKTLSIERGKSKEFERSLGYDPKQNRRR